MSHHYSGLDWGLPRGTLVWTSPICMPSQAGGRWQVDSHHERAPLIVESRGSSFMVIDGLQAQDRSSENHLAGVATSAS
jgi:hypothetical protein